MPLPFPARIGCLGVVLLAASTFIGMMIATAGVAVYPPIGSPAAALLCDGEHTIESQSYSYRPGQSGVSRTFYCEQDGKREDITISVIGASFAIYSLAAALLLLLPLLALHRRLGDAVRSRATLFDRPGEQGRGDLSGLISRIADAARKGGGRVVIRGAADDGQGDVSERLETLRNLREAGLITAEDYESKKAEILAGL